MSASETSTPPGWWRGVFILATAPARAVGRWHDDLWASLVDDAPTFGGFPARVIFTVLVVLAVVYPVVASIVHAVNVAPPRAPSLVLALRPFFDVVYSESLPFMIAAVGIGLFSPALGVLFMTVFIPADLIAASRSTVELHALQKYGWFPAPILGRAISYALLWILAVEIPLRARAWARAWSARQEREPSVVGVFAGRICAAAVLVYFWARAHPWLIRPVFSWTPYQFTYEASTPTWNEWPILVTAATVLAGVSAIWPRPVAGQSASTGSIEPVPNQSLSRVLVRQTIAALLLVGLLAAIQSTVLDVLILTTGLIVAGPVLTAVIARRMAPAFVSGIPMAFRWVGAMAISLAAAWAILKLAGNRIYDSDFVVMLTLAIVAPLFRFLLEVGVGRPARASVPTSPGPPAVTVIWAVLAGTLLCSVLFPSAAWAHDCPQERLECLRGALASPLGLLGAAMLLAAAWFASQPRFVQREIQDQMQFAQDVYRQNRERRTSDDVKDSNQRAVQSGQRNPNIPRRDRKLPW
jgi:hypothetical protein